MLFIPFSFSFPYVWKLLPFVQVMQQDHCMFSDNYILFNFAYMVTPIINYLKLIEHD